MRTRVCPKCGKPYPIGQSCPRCRVRHKGSTRTKEQERKRFDSNPWRREYDKKVYHAARQQVIAMQLGHCARCGRQIAAMDATGAWKTVSGGVHHIKPLSAGGTNEIGNLVLLCAPCHNAVEAMRRREEKR